MKNKVKLYFDKVCIYHEGFCSGSECEYETEDNSKILIFDIKEIKEITPELLEKYKDEDEIPVTNELRMKYVYSLSEEREQKYKGGLSGFCDKPFTNDERINFVSENWLCNQNTYFLTRIELLE